MAGFTYNLNLSVFGPDVLNGVIGQMDRFESKLDQVQKSVLEVGNETKRTEGKAKASFGNMTSGLNGLIARIGATALAWKSLNTTADLDSAERAISFASGKDGAKNIAFVRSEVKRLNLDLMGSMDGFKTIQGSLMGTGLESIGVELFSGMAEASTALGLTKEAFSLSLKAFGQMGSKGGVMMEELKLQLGDHLPGALNLASKAMGVSTKDLIKMMEKGELYSNDFLPKMSRMLHETFGVAAAKNANSARGQINLFNNTLTETYDILGKELLPVFTSFLKDYLIPGVKWLGEHKNLLIGLGKAAAGIYVTLKGFTIANWIVGAFGTVSAIMGVNGALAGTATAVTGIGTALTGLGGPIALLAGLIMYLDHLGDQGKLKMFAYNKFGKSDKEKAAEFERKKQSVLATATGFGFKAPVGPVKNDLGKFLADNFGRDLAPQKPWGPLAGAFGVFEERTKRGADPNKDLSDAAKKGIDGINEGGRHQKNITINLEALIKGMEIKSASLTEGADQVAETLIRKLTQVINSANQGQTTY